MGSKYKYPKDLSGYRVGRLVVTDSEPLHKNGRTYFECLCDCGNLKIVCRSHLFDNTTKSCGCLEKENREMQCNLRIKHGMTNERLYYIWSSMKARCLRESTKSYKNYGGRGIKLFEPWKEFENFKNWSLENGYKDDLTIDRIDVNGNYEPSNCKWSTHTEQARNKRNTVMISYKGQEKTIFEWSEITGISRDRIYDRLRKGWSVEDALERRLYDKRRI